MPVDFAVVSGKFTFRIPSDRLYTTEGVWVLAEANGRARLGLSDFIQQRSGDAAFVEVKPAGTRLQAGGEFASLETIKVSIDFTSPLPGEVLEANSGLETTPETINTDPYGLGWLAVIAFDTPVEDAGLLSPQDYTRLVQRQVEEES